MSEENNMQTLTIASLALNWADEMNLSYVQVLSEEEAEVLKAAKMLLIHAEFEGRNGRDSLLLKAIRSELGGGMIYVGSNQEVEDVSIHSIQVDVVQVSADAANLARTIAGRAMPAYPIIESLIQGLGANPVFCEATGLAETFSDLNLPSCRNVMEVLGF